MKFEKWKVTEGNMGPRGNAAIDIETDSNKFICSIEGHSNKEYQEKGWYSLEEMNYIARLIAAAPNLFDLLKRLDQAMTTLDKDTREGFSSYFYEIDALINKIEGGE